MYVYDVGTIMEFKGAKYIVYHVHPTSHKNRYAMEAYPMYDKDSHLGHYISVNEDLTEWVLTKKLNIRKSIFTAFNAVYANVINERYPDPTPRRRSKKKPLFKVIR
jgi:hypothetical protein